MFLAPTCQMNQKHYVPGQAHQPGLHLGPPRADVANQVSIHGCPGGDIAPSWWIYTPCRGPRAVPGRASSLLRPGRNKLRYLAVQMEKLDVDTWKILNGDCCSNTSKRHAPTTLVSPRSNPMCHACSSFRKATLFQP